MSNKTTDGLMRAALKRAEAAQPKPSKRPRYRLIEGGFGIHRKRTLKLAEELKLAAALSNFRMSPKGSDERTKAFAAIRALPVRMVPVKYAQIQDHSRYPAERLRNIRADGGGPKEKARAARRVAARGDGGTVLANDNEGVGYEATA